MASSVDGALRTTRFRPCIDLHDGIVKQIVGGTLRDAQSAGSSSATPAESAAPAPSAAALALPPAEGGLVTNFVATVPASDFARMYRGDGLTGGHVIMLGSGAANVAAAS